MRASKRTAVAAALVLAAVAFALFLPVPDDVVVVDGSESTTRATDAPYEWAFDSRQDLQLPELPTGCEATALGTLLRLNGIEAGKLDVADAMPKSDEDWVHSFLGDPYSVGGGCCMSPCLAATAREFLEGTGMLAYQTEGCALADLPMPCVVWVTIGLADPQGPIREQGAYEMYYPSHCVVLLSLSDGYVQCVDPREGCVSYPLDRLQEVYRAMGAQAVYIGKE